MLVVLIIVAGAILSCAKTEEFKAPDTPTITESNITIGKVILGKKLENPYSVDNMRRAYSSLPTQTRSEAGDLEINPTHLYVKFTPSTSEELDLLKSDTTLILFPYPLDYEIISGKEDNIFIDLSFENGHPVPHYASVEIDKQLPDNIAYEILEKLFIPDDYSDDAVQVITRSGDVLREAFIESLVDKAMEITGNLNEDNQHSDVTRASAWRPAGKITYYDEYKGAILGVEGIKVKANRWFTTHTGFVNAAGNYSCDGTFKRPADYSFDFEREDFWIKDMKLSKNNVTGNWNYHMVRGVGEIAVPGLGGKTPSPYTYSVLFRAAYDYSYKNVYGLVRPPESQVFRAKIKIKPVNKTDNSVNGVFNTGWFSGLTAKDIEIYNHTDTIQNLYATTIHELTHSAHWRMNRELFIHYTQLIVKESWARGVELYLTRLVYPNYSTPGGYSRMDYTGIVQDLIDPAGLQKTSYRHSNYDIKSEKTYTDNVSGYTLKQIETALEGAWSWEIWRENLKIMYQNPTESHIDAAFAYWKSI